MPRCSGVTPEEVRLDLAVASEFGGLSVSTAMRLEKAAGTRSHGMTRYLIAFDDGAVTFPEEELSDVGRERRDHGPDVSTA